MDIKGIARSTVAILVIAIIIIAGIGAYLATRPPAGKQPGEIWIAIVTDVGGRGDMSFNDMGFRGCDLAKEQGIVDKVTEVISTTAADYLPNLRMLAATGDYDLIIPIGFLLQGATYTVAKEYPQQNFACIDFTADSGYPDFTPMGTPGALGVLFHDEQSGALEGVLAGLIAAQYSKPHVGAVFGMEIPPVIAYEIGFRYGLYWSLSWYENKFGTAAPGISASAIKLLPGGIGGYTGVFDDPALGKSYAVAQLAYDLATCWGAAGATGLGVFTAVEEYHTERNIPTGQPPFILGVDANQDWMKPGLVIGSGMKRIDQAVVNLSRLVRENKFKATVENLNALLVLGMKEGASGISNLELLDDAIQFGIAHEQLTGESVLPGTPDQIKAAVKAMRDAQPAWVWEGVSEFENKILDGTIVVPRVTDSATAGTYRTLWA